MENAVNPSGNYQKPPQGGSFLSPADLQGGLNDSGELFGGLFGAAIKAAGGVGQTLIETGAAGDIAKDNARARQQEQAAQERIARETQQMSIDAQAASQERSAEFAKGLWDRVGFAVKIGVGGLLVVGGIVGGVYLWQGYKSEPAANRGKKKSNNGWLDALANFGKSTKKKRKKKAVAVNEPDEDEDLEEEEDEPEEDEPEEDEPEADEPDEDDDS